MTVAGAVSLAAIVGFVLALLLLVRRRSASTLDYYLAGQRIGVVTNASAICGDYFSAASFLGVAAAVYASGVDGVWYATGFAAGFVPVALFIAAPLRRFGEFSLPDFLGRRLDSDAVRLTAVGIVQLVILCYLVPQAVGSGITWELLVGVGVGGLSPYASGVLVSSAVIAGLAMFGGMRGTTWAQSWQFLFLLAVLLWLAVATVASGFAYGAAVAEAGAQPLRNPVVADGGWTLEQLDNALEPGTPARFDRPGARYGHLGQFALVITLVLGTAGLPHVMNRYFTAPSGRAARMTTVWVLGMAGCFYALAVQLGTAARVAIPEAVGGRPWLAGLTVDGVLRVPEHALLALGRLHGGDAGLALIASGALVAVMSTIAGLLLASAASWGHDVYERYVNPTATQRQAVWAGRTAVAVTATLATLAALTLRPEALVDLFPSTVAQMVTWAFALAGSALTPVLVLAIWWPRLSAPGAVAGMATGAVSAVAAVVWALAAPGSAASALLAPSIVAAPAAITAALVVSVRSRPPQQLEALWLRLHGTAADRQAERLARFTLETGGGGARRRGGSGRRGGGGRRAAEGRRRR
jgi:cation/acetate symporter